MSKTKMIECDKGEDGWKKIGVVGVDSGQLMICDPCYINSEWKKDEKIESNPDKPSSEFSYKGCCETTLDEALAGQLDYSLGHPGAGVVSSAGFGDGVYDVFAKYEDFGESGGTRIAQLKVVMIDENE